MSRARQPATEPVIDRDAPEAPRSGRTKAGLGRGGSLLSGHAVEALFVAVVIFGFASSANFLTMFNIESLLRQAAILGILAVGQYLVIVSGGFDLSVGAVVALSTMITASTLDDHGLIAWPLAILAGAAMGLLSGLAVTVGRIPPFVATLGVMGIARGLAFTVNNEGVVIASEMMRDLNTMSFGPIPLTAVIWAVVVAVAMGLVRLTRWGTYLFAIGGNIDSARLAGVPVARIRASAYVVSGALAALAGILFAARSSSGSPGIANGWELDSIAAVVIGGVSLFGGAGGLGRVVLGVLIYLMLTNLMNLANVDTYLQNVLKGALILAAVLLPTVAQRYRTRGVLE